MWQSQVATSKRASEKPARGKQDAPSARNAGLAADNPRVAHALTWGAIPIGLITLFIALTYSETALSVLLGDPGVVTRYGLPISRWVHDVSFSVTLGSLIFLCAIIPRTTRPKRTTRAAGSTDGGEFTKAFNRLVLVGSIAAVVWAFSAMATLVLSYSDAAALPVTADTSFTNGIFDYMLNFDFGRSWVVVVALAIITSTIMFAARSANGLGWAAGFAGVALVPLALLGHAAGGDDHWGAVNSIGLHLLGVVAWGGGLVALAMVSGLLGGPQKNITGADTNPSAAEVLQRFSHLAGASFFLVALSGVAAGAIRVHTLDQLFGTQYGWFLIIKAVLSILLGFLGLIHRANIIPRLKNGDLTARTAAWRIIGVEVAIMSAVAAIAVVLARTQPPVSTAPPEVMSPARRLSGYELPPELTISSWATVWRFDWLWVAIIVFLAIAYGRWARRVHAKGGHWDWWRTLSFYVGLASLFYITSGPIAVYGQNLFSMHMVAHMALTMVAPFFLVVGSPIALALKAIPARRDGTRGPREWTLVFLHSKWAKGVTNPIVAAVNFTASIVIFYSTDLMWFSMKYHIGHEFMNFHFLLTGYVLAVNMIGLDPLPHRAPHFVRLVILLITMIFHAFYATSIMGTDVLIQPDWFGNQGREWGPSAIEDQRIGAGVMWGIGEVPTLMLAVGVAVAWSRSEERIARRDERVAERTGNRELRDYNEMLQQLQGDQAQGLEEARRAARIRAGLPVDGLPEDESPASASDAAAPDADAPGGKGDTPRA